MFLFLFLFSPGNWFDIINLIKLSVRRSSVDISEETWKVSLCFFVVIALRPEKLTPFSVLK